MRASYKKMLEHAVKNAPFYTAVYVLLTILVAVLPVIELYFFNLMIRGVLEERILNDWWIIAVYLLCSMLVPRIVLHILSVVQTKIQNELDIVWAGSALEKTTLVEATYVETGEGVNNAFRATQTQDGGVCKTFFLLNDLIIDCFIVLFIVIQMKTMGIITLVLGIILFLTTYRIGLRIAESNTQFYWSIQEENRYCSSIYGLLNNRNIAGEIKQYDTYNWIFSSYRNRTKDNNKREVHFTKGTQIKSGVIEGIQIISIILSVILYYSFVCCGLLAADYAITGVYATTKVFSKVSGLVEQLNHYKVQQMLIAEYNRLQEHNEEYSNADQEVTETPAIELENVKYRYMNAHDYALKGVSFKIHPGEKVVLVGENGTGKSTLLRLLMGVDSPSEGSIKIDGVKLKNSLKAFREHITFMGQRYFVYDLSLFDNIVISDSDIISSERLDEAIQWAGLKDTIAKLPDGINTDIVQGELLSGGEWQKVALARMKYRDRNVILMDEPNAAVDAEYEIALYRKLFTLAKGKTMLIVSHRLPICQIADKIIVMNNGKVVEMGTHKELIQIKNGYYKELFETQAELYAD